MFKHLTMRTGFVPCLILVALGQGCSTFQPGEGRSTDISRVRTTENWPGVKNNAQTTQSPLGAAQKYPALIQAGYSPPSGQLGPQSFTLDELLQLTLTRNPRLTQASFAIDAAKGRAVQAGLYPNPTVDVRADELGDRTGPGGILTAPAITQEIVTANKLGLNRAAANRVVDQATLTLVGERYARFTAVRQNYFDVLTLQRRTAILDELVKLAEQSVSMTQKLLDAKQVARLDLIQLEIELERFRAEREATKKELPAAFRRLAASVGVSGLPEATVVGSLEMSVPNYDLESARLFLLENHPDVRSARVGVERAQLHLKRAQVEPIPNVTVGASYIRQYENRSHDLGIGVSVPVPLWNRNQGNIQAAQAEIGEAVQQVGRVENELTERLATAFGTYASSRQRAERYRTAILPKARESYQLSLKAYQGGQFEYLRVLQAQRSVAEANLDYVRSLGELWRSASEIAGLLLEDNWPSTSPDPTLPVRPKEE
jgi:cobalt-zinc-cadmium efflux system outer membrane protein